MTPLHLAAESGHIKIVGYLFDQGADINIQDEDGVIIHSNTGWKNDELSVSLISRKGCITFSGVELNIQAAQVLVIAICSLV